NMFRLETNVGESHVLTSVSHLLWLTERVSLHKVTQTQDSRGQLQTTYNNLTKHRDQLQASYNTLSKERDQLQTRYNILTKERDQLQTHYNTLTKERDQLRTRYNTLTKERDQLQTNYNILTKDRDQLQTERDFVNQICWQKFDSSLYFLSTETKTWEESREDCLERGADLVIIDSSTEQTFLFNLNLKAWIGLTDSVTEGTWKWVDGTTLTTGYWGAGQPDDSGQEDCVEIYYGQDDPVKTWNDDKCGTNNNWICEKVYDPPPHKYLSPFPSLTLLKDLNSLC
uniref:C-type lectin domain-containing protein n=1 Tax=Salmo trutta TaxID=8032 RepID=A0A673VX88_SALTR